MSSLSIVDDSSVLRSDIVARLQPVILTGNTDLSGGFGNANSMIYICTAAVTLTLPNDYARHKGKILHVVGAGGNVIVPSVLTPTFCGAVFPTTSSTVAINAAASPATGTLAASGSWASLVCDGSTGWLVFATDS